MAEQYVNNHCDMKSESPFDDLLALVKGAGDLATGVAWRLHRSGIPVVMTELPRPLTVRRAVAFAQAVYDDEHEVEGITARKALVADVPEVLEGGGDPRFGRCGGGGDRRSWRHRPLSTQSLRKQIPARLWTAQRSWWRWGRALRPASTATR